MVDLLKDIPGNKLDIINQMAAEFRYEKISTNLTVFRSGEYGDKFYLLIKGSVAELGTKEIKEQLTEEEYLIYLIRLRKYREFDLISKCLSINISIFRIEDSIFESWLRKPDINLTSNIYANRNIRIAYEINQALATIKERDALTKITPSEYISRIKNISR